MQWLATGTFAQDYYLSSEIILKIVNNFLCAKVPTANLRALINKTRTTYDQCINDKAFVVMQHANNFNRLEICNRLRRQHQRPFAADSRTNN